MHNIVQYWDVVPPQIVALSQIVARRQFVQNFTPQIVAPPQIVAHLGRQYLVGVTPQIVAHFGRQYLVGVTQQIVAPFRYTLYNFFKAIIRDFWVI